MLLEEQTLLATTRSVVRGCGSYLPERVLTNAEIAKMVDAPIFHVNGEDPIAVMEMAKIALEFRHEFGRDVVVDKVLERRPEEPAKP